MNIPMFLNNYHQQEELNIALGVRDYKLFNVYNSSMHTLVCGLNIAQSANTFDSLQHDSATSVKFVTPRVDSPLHSSELVTFSVISNSNI